jgi:hypothetical protein
MTWLRSTLRGISMIGIVASLAAHIEALMGVDPRDTFKQIWTFQILLLFLLLPIVFRIFRERSLARVLHPTGWLKFVTWGMLCYYAATFYWFLFWAAEHLDPTKTWRMVSAGWILLFLVATCFYETKPKPLA